MAALTTDASDQQTLAIITRRQRGTAHERLGVVCTLCALRSCDRPCSWLGARSPSAHSIPHANLTHRALQGLELMASQSTSGWHCVAIWSSRPKCATTTPPVSPHSSKCSRTTGGELPGQLPRPECSGLPARASTRSVKTRTRKRPLRPSKAALDKERNCR